MSRFLCSSCFPSITYQDDLYTVIVCAVTNTIIYSAIALFFIWIVTARLYYKEKNPEDRDSLITLSITISIFACVFIAIYNILGDVNTYLGYHDFVSKLMKQGYPRESAEQIARSMLEKSTGIDLSLASLVLTKGAPSPVVVKRQ
jgi:hypothetical protein